MTEKTNTIMLNGNSQKSTHLTTYLSYSKSTCTKPILMFRVLCEHVENYFWLLLFANRLKIIYAIENFTVKELYRYQQLFRGRISNSVNNYESCNVFNFDKIDHSFVLAKQKSLTKTFWFIVWSARHFYCVFFC